MFEIKLATNGQFYFVLKAGNHQTILKSEMYTAKANCKKGIASVQNNAPEDKNYDRKESKNGQFYFNLVAKNGEVIGTSEMYTTAQAMESGIESVKRTAPTAEIVEK